MYPTTIVAVGFVLVLSLIIRSLDAFKFIALGTDTFVNLLYSKHLKNRSPNLYRIGKIVYPPLLPQLLNKLQRILSVRSLHVIPKFFDVLTSMTVLLFTLWLSGNEYIAFLAFLIYTLSPINVINGYGISTRNIGSFFLVSALMASYVAIVDNRCTYLTLAFAIASSALMMFTSRIAYKSYFLFAIVAGILFTINGSMIIFPLVSVISLALCLLVSKGRFVDDVKGHIFLINFFRNRRRKKESALKRIALVLYYDVWWSVAILAIVGGANLFLAAWLLSILVLSFAWPWGEGERHIALGTAPASILAASYLSSRPLSTALLLLLEVLVISRSSARVLQGKYLVSVDRRLMNLFSAVKEIKGDSLFLCLPPAYNSAVAYFCEKKVLFGESSSREGVIFQAEVVDAIKTQNGLDELAAKYPVTHIFIDKDTSLLEFKSNQWIPVIQDGCYAVMERKKG